MALRRFVPLLAGCLGCGSETTDLIPALGDLPTQEPPGNGTGGARQPCVEASVYPGGGFYKPDISETSGMALNGSAASVAGSLQLVPIQETQVGSAYFEAPVAFDRDTSVFAHFTFRIGGGDGLEGADGLAFVLQSDPRGTEALGWVGYGKGYQGVAPSVAVEFDTFFNEMVDSSPYHVALTADGKSEVHIASVDPPFQPNDGVARSVWIDYDGSTDQLEVFVSETSAKPASPLLSHVGFDFSPALEDSVFIGVSASSGALVNAHELSGAAWFVTSQLPKCR